MSTEDVIAALDRGEIRVAEKSGGEWRVNEEAKAAILAGSLISGLAGAAVLASVPEPVAGDEAAG